MSGICAAMIARSLRQTIRRTMSNSPTEAQRNKAIATWLLICCGMVFAMIVLGGVTRLTGSGLSIAEWRPIMGALPPLSEAEWQQTPEFQKVNSHFDVNDFKGIFWLEYLHRVLGRLLGFVFALPLVYFVARNYIALRELPWYLLMLALGGVQAVIGKIMVASGQVDAPNVSHFRLTAHLAAAVLVYALMFWRSLGLLNPTDPGPRHRWYRKTTAVTTLIVITILSGGFVAGLDAGLVYPTFPMMGEYWFPPELFSLDPFWHNFFDNRTTVQFDHRLLAITTFVFIVVFWVRARSVDLPLRARRGANALLHTAVLQVVLGISTLLLAVPVWLAASHQGVAMLLFTVALYLQHSLRRG
jgi:cytochrome c oxidase assembly protein subunit 15